MAPGEAVRIGRVVTGRVRIERRQPPDYTRVYDAETGAEVKRIRIDYGPRIECAQAGQRIRFERFVEGPTGGFLLSGPRVVTEVWRVVVDEVSEGAWPPITRQLPPPPAPRGEA